MPEEWRLQLEQLDQPWFFRMAWGGGVILLLLFGWLLWHNYYLSPRQAFWQTINNNLVTVGVTKHTLQQVQAGSLDQTEQIRLGSVNAVKVRSVVKQNSGDQHTTVATESIGTPNANFNRYISISQLAGQHVNFKPILGVWSTQAVDNKTVTSTYLQSLYGEDLFPFAFLNATQRETIVGSMQQNHVYTIDYSKVEHKKQNGKNVYEYTVQVAPAAYIGVLKQIDQYSGLNGLSALKTSDYASAGAVSVTVDIDPVARQIVRLVSNSQTRDLSGYGAQPQIVTPNTKLSQADLQSQLSKLLSTP